MCEADADNLVRPLANNTMCLLSVHPADANRNSGLGSMAGNPNIGFPPGRPAPVCKKRKWKKHEGQERRMGGKDKCKTRPLLSAQLTLRTTEVLFPRETSRPSPPTKPGSRPAGARARWPFRRPGTLQAQFELLPVALKAQQHKTNFQKMVDSVLAKSAKIRALVADLKKNYDDEAATKPLIRILSR